MAGSESGFDVFSPGSTYIVLDAGGYITHFIVFYLHPLNILAQLSIVLPDSGYFLNLDEINTSNVSHDKVCSSSRGKMRTDCFINVTIHYCSHILSQTIK